MFMHVNNLLISAFILSAGWVCAQQDPLFSHAKASLILNNAAFAGAGEITSVDAVYRHQWLGFSYGAPRTAFIHGDSYFTDYSSGVAASFIHDRIGVSQFSGVNFSYAYHIPLGNDHVSLGLNAGLLNFSSRWTEVATVEANDPSFSDAGENIWYPLFGAGALYYGDNYYAGVAVPHMLNYSWENDFQLATLVSQSSQYVHWLVSAGYLFMLSPRLYLKSFMNARIVQAAPVQVDLGMNLEFYKAVTAGLTYRSSDAVVFSVGLRPVENLLVGYAFDFLITRLAYHSSGCHEILLRWLLPAKNQSADNMRPVFVF
jgi:type IX secretion system PorP/SprF family membrane protein